MRDKPLYISGLPEKVKKSFKIALFDFQKVEKDLNSYAGDFKGNTVFAIPITCTILHRAKMEVVARLTKHRLKNLCFVSLATTTKERTVVCR